MPWLVGFLGAGGAFAVFMGGVFFDEPELDGSAFVAVGFAHAGFEVTAVTPVDVTSVATEDLEGRRRVVGFLDHVVELGAAVLEAGWRVAVNGFAQPFIKGAGSDKFVALGVDVQGQVEK